MSVSPSGQTLTLTLSQRARGYERKAWDSNPHDPLRGRTVQQTGPANHIRLPSEGFLTQVDRRGLEPRFPGCKPSVFPLDQRPYKRSVRELNPIFLPTEEACSRNTYRPISDPGWS
jgi:hypothetical protein